LFGIFARKKETTAEAVNDIINEISDLKQNLHSCVNKICSEHIFALNSSFAEHLSVVNSSLSKKISELEEQIQQNLRQERRQQMMLESIIENQHKTLEMLENREISPPMEALMSLAENLALTHLAAPDTPELSILYSKLSSLMECYGLSLISEADVDFDSEKHEACGARCVPYQRDGSVLEIVRPGFMLRGKVLRCATVVVNRHDFNNIDDYSEDSGSIWSVS